MVFLVQTAQAEIGAQIGSGGTAVPLRPRNRARHLSLIVCAGRRHCAGVSVSTAAARPRCREKLRMRLYSAPQVVKGLERLVLFLSGWQSSEMCFGIAKKTTGIKRTYTSILSRSG